MNRHPRPPRSESTSIAALSTVRLTKDYGDGPVLHPLDVTIAPGERVALVGHNGSGKTTLLRMAAGLLDVTDGAISIFGHAPGSLEARRHLSYVSDTPIFYDDLSVWEHLEYTARMHGVTDWHQEASDLLDLLGLFERADDLPVRFSRGLKQKAALALAFVRPFDLLLVDEPFVGLDAAGRDAFLTLVRESSPERTIVIATHEPSFLAEVPRVVALRNGELVYDGTAAEAVDGSWVHSTS